MIIIESLDKILLLFNTILQTYKAIALWKIQYFSESLKIFYIILEI